MTSGDGSSKQERKRRRIFSSLRHSLESAGMPVAGAKTLICPICWKEVEYRQLELEHIIPRALKGRRETLTCSECNRSAGADLDHHVVGHHKFQEVMQGHGSMPWQLDVNGHRLAVQMSRDVLKPGINFKVIERATSQDAIASSKAEFEQRKVQRIPAKFRFGFNERKRQIGMLKMAYLATFHRFGYRLIERPGMQFVRKLIVSRGEGAPDLTGIMGEMELPDFLSAKQMLFMDAQFVGVNFVWVILKCRIETTVSRFVMLPIEDVGEQIFAQLAHHAEDNPQFTVDNLRAEQFIV